MLGEFKVCVVAPEQGPDVMDQFHTSPICAGDADYRENSRLKGALPQVTLEAMMSELASLGTSAAAFPVAVLHRSGEAFVAMADGKDRFFVCDSHALQAGWMSPDALLRFVLKGGTRGDFLQVVFALSEGL